MAKSHASKAVVESNPGTGLPAGFTGGPVEVAAPLYVRTPYVLAVSPKGQTFAKVAQQIPDLQDGDPVLVQGDEYLRLNPFRFYIVDAFQHYSKVDGQGQIVETTLDPDAAKADGEYKEHIETMIIVQVADNLVPATCTFKTTKTNAAHRALDTLEKASDLESWSKLSGEHKASAAVPYPYARFINTVTMKRGTGKASGFAFVAWNSMQRPTGLADWDRLAAYFADTDNKKLAEAVYERYKDRVADIKAGA